MEMIPVVQCSFQEAPGLLCKARVFFLVAPDSPVVPGLLLAVQRSRFFLQRLAHDIVILKNDLNRKERHSGDKNGNRKERGIGR